LKALPAPLAPFARRLWRGLACALGAGTLLAGCALPGAAVRPVPTAAASESFAVEGRVSVRFGEDSLAGRIAWAHSAARDEISLASPLGNQLALIVREPAGVALTDASRNLYQAADVETLTERHLGWRLPLAGLSDWVRARPGAGAVTRRDAEGRPVHVAEAGWAIEFDYEGAARLPRRLVMVFTRGERPLEIRLVIDHWS
jgi:outer membrane lipoprotein LolB